MSSNPPQAQDASAVNYENPEVQQNSELQVLWSRTMDRTKYRTTSNYRKVHVLLLSWAVESADLDVDEEVERLEAVFEKHFRYNTSKAKLHDTPDKKLQVQVNAKVAAFVGEHDGPDTLLIVYYAGHGKPGEAPGQLHLFAHTTPNRKRKRRDSLDTVVWNRSEASLIDAEADVLELFDCCYAGVLGQGRGQTRLFEYLAATTANSTTPLPGPESFTSALIFALEALVKEQDRFTTVELLNKIRRDAPSFPKDQTPVLSDRIDITNAGRIMLCPLQEESSTAPKPPKADPRPDPAAMRHTLTLHVDFSRKPLPRHVEDLANGLIEVFERNTLSVNGVRWGGMESVYFRAARGFLEGIKRRRSKNLQRRPTINIPSPRSSPGSEYLNTPDPMTPSPMTPLSTQHTSPTLNVQISPPKSDPESATTSLDLDAEMGSK